MATVYFQSEVREIGGPIIADIPSDANKRPKWLPSLISILSVDHVEGEEGEDQNDLLRDFRCSFSISDADYLASLATAVEVDSDGGHSGAIFSKTADGKFIVKQIGRTDYATMSRIRKSYVAHMKTGYPTCLDCILGMYQLNVEGAVVNLIVMERIRSLPGTVMTKVGDLKGTATDRFKPVPLVQRDFLFETLERDTAYLESQGLVDYSLLVLADSKSSILVVGIIDFLMVYNLKRAYNCLFRYHWRRPILKGLEVVCKYHCCKEITFVPPADYRNRLLNAVDGYFPSSP